MKLVVIGPGSELIAEPLKAQTRTLGDAHHVPGARHGVAEGMHAPSRIVMRLILVRENNAGCAQRAGDYAGLDNAIAYRAGSLVTATGHHRRALGQTRCFGRRAGDLAGDAGRFVHDGKDAVIEIERVNQLQRPRPIHHIEQRGAGCIGDRISQIIILQVRPSQMMDSA